LLEGLHEVDHLLGADFLISAFLIADTEDPKNEIKRHVFDLADEEPM
jgi:hypothetical protein